VDIMWELIFHGSTLGNSCFVRTNSSLLFSSAKPKIIYLIYFIYM